METKVATTCFNWLQPSLHHSPSSCSSSQALASAISSPSKGRLRRSDGGILTCRFAPTFERSALFGTPSTKLSRTRSHEFIKPKIGEIKRACSAGLDAFSDEEFSKNIEELALRFQLSAENDEVAGRDSGPDAVSDSMDKDASNMEESALNRLRFEHFENQFPPSQFLSADPPWPEICLDPPDWAKRDAMIPVDIEWKANSVDLPLSLRIIKRKIQWQEGIREAGESAYCSVTKAFSTMVFMIQELHSYTLQLREILLYKDLQGILVRVQNEMHASFVWLFQQVFSPTPTLMVYVMILLANFTVYSMGHNTALAASSLPPSIFYSTTTETASSLSKTQNEKHHKFSSSTIKTFSVSSASGNKSTAIGGNHGGGGKARPVSSGTDGDGRFDQSEVFRTILPHGASQLSSFGTTRETESLAGDNVRDREVDLWNSIVDEASQMQAELRDEALDHDTMEKFVSPVNARIEADDYADYFKTELLYQTGLSQEPNNPLLLANYAQFLFLIAHDYDRAEEYFKRAIGVQPPDAEAYNKYATFLWMARKDLWAAEETFLEAISADPTNSYYAANYAHFLWNTGGEDTCFPLPSPDATQ